MKGMGFSNVRNHSRALTNPWQRWMIGGGLLLPLWIIFSSVAVIPTGKRGVVTYFGKVQNQILDEGIHFKLPFVTGVKVLSVRVKRTDIKVPVGTKDLQIIDTDLALNWHLNPEQVNVVFQRLGDEEAIVERIINPAITEVLKAATPKKTAEELIKQRAELKTEIDSQIKARLAGYGIQVDDVSLVNLSFSPEFTKAIETKQIAEQEAKKAEYVAQKAIKEAEAEVNRAKGQAEAQRLQRETLTPSLLQKQAIEKWDGRFPTVMAGEGAMPLINLSPNIGQP
jgi:prohibitin 1